MFTVTMEVAFDDENVNTMNVVVGHLKSLEKLLSGKTEIASIHVEEEYIDDND